MKKISIYLFLGINLFYIVNFLVNFEHIFLEWYWLAFFIIGLGLSILDLLKPNKENPYILIALLVTSLSSIGFYGFQYFLFHLMG
ncbi:hypothetical protein M3175_11110 [Robertmurraya korlensis]|uniref:hypothetical protein n=1 Tax=Robertmurraya korlensis TaxID=519977 RepID=UPI00203EF278|nr:hypothetical protein [Robertmurraya korlensis]MCM3601281.1 hypothetical protein [Robertmurraya korlensis]